MKKKAGWGRRLYIPPAGSRLYKGSGGQGKKEKWGDPGKYCVEKPGVNLHQAGEVHAVHELTIPKVNGLIHHDGVPSPQSRHQLQLWPVTNPETDSTELQLTRKGSSHCTSERPGILSWVFLPPPPMAVGSTMTPKSTYIGTTYEWLGIGAPQRTKEAEGEARSEKLQQKWATTQRWTTTITPISHAGVHHSPTHSPTTSHLPLREGGGIETETGVDAKNAPSRTFFLCWARPAEKAWLWPCLTGAGPSRLTDTVPQPWKGWVRQRIERVPGNRISGRESRIPLSLAARPGGVGLLVVSDQRSEQRWFVVGEKGGEAVHYTTVPKKVEVTSPKRRR